MKRFNLRGNAALWLAGINVGVFLLTYIMPRLLPLLALSPYALLRAGFFWTPLTYMFAHGGFTHLLFNTFFLFMAGPVVEERMGSSEFLIYYLLTGILAGIFSVFAYLFSGLAVPIVGASGALYAVLLALATYYPNTQLMVFFVLPMRAPMALLLFTGLDIIFHWTGRTGVAHLTHLSGLLFGFLYFIIRLKINPIRAMRNSR